MRVPMTAKRNFVYAGHNYRAGQEFEAHSESNARFLVQVGHAERYQTRAILAETVDNEVDNPSPETPVAWSPDGEVPRKKRAYKRRDLTVEE